MTFDFSGFRQAFRRLVIERRYSTAVVLILAIGIGPSAAMLTVFYDILLRPLAYREPERLGILRLSMGQLRNHPGLSPAEAIDVREAGMFESVEVETRLSVVSLGPPSELVPLTQLNITTGMLPMLGVAPVLGRLFTEADIPTFPPPPRLAPGAPLPPPPPPQLVKILIDYGTWQTHFNGDRRAIGRVVQINGGPAEIIGVLPDGFQLATGRAIPQRIDVYMPLRLTEFRNSWMFPTLVRLKPGTSFTQTQAALDVLAANLRRDFPAFYDAGLSLAVTPLLDDMTGATKPALRAAAAAVLLLMGIALANATALVVARLKSRETDLAIRSAIGATPRALIRDVLRESLLLASAAALLSGVLAVAAIAGVRAVIPRTVPRWDQIAVSWQLLLLSAALSLIGLVIFGLIPVWKVARGATVSALRTGTAQGGKAQGARSRLALVGAQIALTVVLAFGCVQLLRSAAQLSRVDLGYEPNVLTFRVPYDFRLYPDPPRPANAQSNVPVARSQRAELYQRIRDRVRQVPGVVTAGIVTHLPLSGSTMMDGYSVDVSREVSADKYANYQAVTPGYFEAMQIAIVQGRDFTDAEDATQQRVIVIDDTLARAAFPGESQVVGKQLRLGWGVPTSRIVGVVKHARTIEVGRVVRPQVYAPMGNLFQNAGMVVVRAAGDPRALAGAVTAAINEVRPGRAVSNVAMLSDNVTAATSTVVAVTGLLTFLAASAGLLSAVGLYLVIAFVVHQRRRETAIRSALGATRAQVMWTNVRTSVVVLCAALPAGALLSLAAAPFLSELVYAVEPRSPGSLAFAALAAAVTGLLGTLVPVRRAAAANIVKILRES